MHQFLGTLYLIATSVYTWLDQPWVIPFLPAIAVGAVFTSYLFRETAWGRQMRSRLGLYYLMAVMWAALAMPHPQMSLQIMSQAAFTTALVAFVGFMVTSLIGVCVMGLWHVLFERRHA